MVSLALCPVSWCLRQSPSCPLTSLLGSATRGPPRECVTKLRRKWQTAAPDSGGRGRKGRGPAAGSSGSHRLCREHRRRAPETDRDGLRPGLSARGEGPGRGHRSAAEPRQHLHGRALRLSLGFSFQFLVFTMKAGASIVNF